MKVHVEYVRELKRQLAMINHADLHDIEFYEDRKLIEIDQEVIDKFKFTGLNNVDFVMFETYKEKL